MNMDKNKNDAMNIRLYYTLLIALDVVVPGHCGSGKYCTARKIDKMLARMMRDKGIDGTKA